MPLGDIYELTHEQTLYGQTVNNVYFYRQALAFALADPTTAQVLATEWEDQILESIANLQSPDVTYQAITVRNLFDASDQYSLLISGGGLSGGTSGLPAFAAFPFKLQGTNAAVKQGAKRIAGVPEEIQTDGVVTESGAIDLLEIIAEKLASPVTVGLLIEDPVFIPVTVKRVRSGSPGSYEYRLPENEGEAVWSQIAVAIFELLISTQNSRKIGRGI